MSEILEQTGAYVTPLVQTQRSVVLSENLVRALISGSRVTGTLDNQ